MRIISKFHDYYDTALSYGDDASLVYLRHTSEDRVLEDKKHKLRDLIEAEKDRQQAMSIDFYNKVGKHPIHLRVQPMFLYFCGKTYPIYKVEHERANEHYYYRRRDELSNVEYYPDKEDMFRRCTELTGLDFASYAAKNNQYMYHMGRFTTRNEEPYTKRLDSMLADIGRSDKAGQILQEYNIPIMLLDTYGSRLILNPRLLDYQVQKVIDPWTAFQEIEMYAGGVLKRQDVMTSTISDKDRIAQHGFDKWSFRKMPSPD